MNKHELAEQYYKEYESLRPFGVDKEHAFKAGFDACLTELAKQSEVKLDIQSIEDNVVEKWSMHWFDPKINEEDTKNYRRRILSVDANMRYSIARMMSEYAQPALLAANAKIAQLESELQEAEKTIQRLSECHLPKKACKGEDLTQVMLEENTAIAKTYLQNKGE